MYIKACIHIFSWMIIFVYLLALKNTHTCNSVYKLLSFIDFSLKLNEKREKNLDYIKKKSQPQFCFKCHEIESQ